MKILQEIREEEEEALEIEEEKAAVEVRVAEEATVLEVMEAKEDQETYNLEKIKN